MQNNGHIVYHLYTYFSLVNCIKNKKLYRIIEKYNAKFIAFLNTLLLLNYSVGICMNKH